jgi:hypothetical protein
MLKQFFKSFLLEIVCKVQIHFLDWMEGSGTHTELVIVITTFKVIRNKSSKQPE